MWRRLDPARRCGGQRGDDSRDPRRIKGPRSSLILPVLRRFEVWPVKSVAHRRGWIEIEHGAWFDGGRGAGGVEEPLGNAGSASAILFTRASITFF